MATSASTMDQCIQNCNDCRVVTSRTLTQTCLKSGDEHLEPSHVQLMLDCVAACTACVDFMSRESDFHAHYCGACAKICKACADSCESVGGMQECVDACRRCAQSCREMGK